MLSTLRNIILLLSLCLFPACLGDETDEMVEYVKIGDRLPAFSVTLNDGTLFDSAQPEASIIVLFSTSCADCQKELPTLDTLYKSGAFTGRRVVCISRAETAGSVEAFWRANGLTLPYSAQADRRIFSLFASAGIPRIYIVDAQGIVTGIFYSADGLVVSSQ